MLTVVGLLPVQLGWESAQAVCSLRWCQSTHLKSANSPGPVDPGVHGFRVSPRAACLPSVHERSHEPQHQKAMIPRYVNPRPRFRHRHNRPQTAAKESGASQTLKRNASCVDSTCADARRSGPDLRPYCWQALVNGDRLRTSCGLFGPTVIDFWSRRPSDPLVE
jgi:hypothetical protein